MTTAAPDNTATPPHDEFAAADAAPLIPRHIRRRITTLAGLLIVLHWELLYRLGRFASEDGDWSHAFLVPLFSIYFIYMQREQIAAAVPRTYWPGLALLLSGIAGYFLGLAIRCDMLRGYSLIIEIAGLALLLTGPSVMRYLWFPIAYLVFAVKINESIWSAIAHRLQLLAAEGAALLLNLIGIAAAVTDTTIDLFRGLERIGSLSVAEACSGMRMLITFLALSVAMAYLWKPPSGGWWARGLLVALAVPIAIVVNIARVALLGGLYMIDPAYTRGDLHLFMGMLMLVPALALLLLTAWVLNAVLPGAGEKESGGGSQESDATRNAKRETRNVSRAFLAACAVLLLAAVALHATVLALGHHLIQRALPLRQPLYLFPQTLGPWQRVSDETLSREVAEELGTHRYLLWTYRDRASNDAVKVLIAYYSGVPDSTPHITARHYTAGGAPGISLDPRKLNVAEQVTIPFAGVMATTQLGTRFNDAVVATFYIANGSFAATPQEVQALVTRPENPYAYWCKVELMPGTISGNDFRGVASPHAAAETIQRFIPHLLPPLMETLPEWKAAAE